MAKRVSLSKQQQQSEAGAELLSLCQSMTEDGSLTKEEIVDLTRWLRDNEQSELPAIEFLAATVNRIIADKKVTKDEQRELYAAIEKILPPEVRKDAVDARRAIERQKRDAERAEQQAAKERERQEKRTERERNSPIARANFMVAGVRHEGRPEIIASCVDEGTRVFLLRDRNNRYSRHAIEVRIDGGYQIGFVPEEDAARLAPLLDQGGKHDAHVTKVLTGGRSPIPVVQAYIYRGDASVPLAVTQRQVPAAEQSERKAGCASAILSLALSLTALLIAVARLP